MTAAEHTAPAVLPTQTPTYKSWASMRRRCTNPKAVGFEHYGGRGISVHPEWLASYSAFFADMGERPSGTSLDRIDPNKGYYPGNCRWADRKTQARNKHSLRFLTIDGVTRCLSEWEELRGLPSGILRQRIKLGWSGDLLFAPKHTRRAASASTTSSGSTSATVVDGLHALMRAQMQREFELAHGWLDMPPPEAGNYLVSVRIDDEGDEKQMRSVRLDYFDGKGWPRMGGYVVYEKWKPVPEAWEG